MDKADVMRAIHASIQNIARVFTKHERAGEGRCFFRRWRPRQRALRATTSETRDAAAITKENGSAIRKMLGRRQSCAAG